MIKRLPLPTFTMHHRQINISILTLKVENASEAISKVETSTYLKKLKKSSELSIILAKASYRAHSLNIEPQFKAISCNSYLYVF